MVLPDRPRVVVTGAGSGLGRALCLHLATRDARVVVCDINVRAAEETAALMRGGEAIVVPCDVARAEQVEHLADESFRRLGGVDLLVNNAGVAVAGEVGEVPLADWEWVVGVNLWGVIHGCHFFVPRMRAQRSGHILNVASAAGLLAGPMMAPYNVTKAGVVALSETLRADLAEHGVGVSVLCPTFFMTNIAASSRGATHLRPVVEALLRSGKLSADDVARLAIEGCEREELYVSPHADGRWMWRVKRVAPELFHALLPRITAWQLKRYQSKLAS
ncbi:MAG: SDR family NAD(P)-dependent oxidoreductase [Deltaproteobacteria bacterium]|nr:SDR family NAD(P)-dependent oxidoreductase [Deltaproteobacteria bacterium]